MNKTAIKHAIVTTAAVLAVIFVGRRLPVVGPIISTALNG